MRFVPISLERLKVAAAVAMMTGGVFFAFRLVGSDAGPLTAPTAPSVEAGGIVHAWTTTTATPRAPRTTTHRVALRTSVQAAPAVAAAQTFRPPVATAAAPVRSTPVRRARTVKHAAVRRSAPARTVARKAVVVRVRKLDSKLDISPPRLGAGARVGVRQAPAPARAPRPRPSRRRPSPCRPAAR